MRVRPDGAELLRTARAAIDAAIVPFLAGDRGDAVRAIERALALGEERLSRDEEGSAAEIAALEDARAAMRAEIFEALPRECRYDARLIAKAIAVATRQLANGHMPERREYERLAALLRVPAVAYTSAPENRRSLRALSERLCASIRAGDADEGTSSYAATLAHLEATTREALSESNPSAAGR